MRKVLGLRVSTKVLTVADYRKWEASGTNSEEHTHILLENGTLVVAQGLVRASGCSLDSRCDAKAQCHMNLVDEAVSYASAPSSWSVVCASPREGTAGLAWMSLPFD